ncbi:MAG: TusE/DsrC/DsvC family sulfur relay protein [Myxococcota bacterium]|jgi:TusE/DsrC/DsvC family sulfur relay protein
MATMNDTAPQGGDQLSRIERQLAQMAAQMNAMTERQLQQQALFEMMQPMLRLGLDGAVETMQGLEDAGYFTFGSELLSVVDRIVRAYGADDVRRLGDQIVGILDTVRNVTQPDMLKMVNDVVEAVHDADTADPKGMWGLARAGKDKDVRKGIGLFVAILKQVGQAAERIAKDHPDTPPVRLSVYGGQDGEEAPKWVRHLAPSRRPSKPRQPAPARSEPAAAPGRASVANLPAGYGSCGFLLETDSWTRDLAVAAASALGIETLTDAHWQVISWARGEFLATGTAANLRKLSKGAEVGIRDLYQLFPGRPGTHIATIAGTKKPAGCI